MITEKSQVYIIGIDIGTGSTKAVAMDSKGIIICNSQFFNPTQNLHPGFSEQDPALIWKAFTDCINKIITDLKHPPVSISLSSAMHSLMVMDKNNKSITSLITWADTRSGNIAERIRNLPAAKTLYKTTGTPIHSMTPLCKIIWLKENAPKIFAAAYKFISIKEFIWFKLFKAFEIDHSIASATGLFDIKKLKWNDFSLKLCGINSAKLSEIVPTNFLRKNVDSSICTLLHISSETFFCIGASDGCTANVGSYAVAKGTAALTIGTSGAVRIASSKPIFDFASMSFNYLLDEKTFICGGPVNNGGNVVEWLFETILNNSKPSKRDYKNLFKIIDTIPAGSKGLIFLPYLFGERAPVWDEKSSGIFFGIKSSHTHAFFLRATLEGICYSMNQVLGIVESSTKKIVQLNVGGGFIHSRIWMQILADITGKKLCVIETEDSSAIGAALINMKALNMIKEYDSLKPKNNQVVDPDMKDHAVYEKYYAVFKRLYKPMKKLMHDDYDVAADLVSPEKK
ncbi:MAG: gluconokinase [Ginsengibacter sp.]